MRSAFDMSTLTLADIALVLAVVTYLKDPGLPLLGGPFVVARVLPSLPSR
jgi:hypothetical protein